MNLELWQTVKSGSTEIRLELLRAVEGDVIGELTLDIERDSELLERAQKASLEARQRWREEEVAKLTFAPIGPIVPKHIDRSDQVQAMIRAVAEVLFPDVDLKFR